MLWAFILKSGILSTHCWNEASKMCHLEEIETWDRIGGGRPLPQRYNNVTSLLWAKRDVVDRGKSKWNWNPSGKEDYLSREAGKTPSISFCHRIWKVHPQNTFLLAVLASFTFSSNALVKCFRQPHRRFHFSRQRYNKRRREWHFYSVRGARLRSVWATVPTAPSLPPPSLGRSWATPVLSAIKRADCGRGWIWSNREYSNEFNYICSKDLSKKVPCKLLSPLKLLFLLTKVAT